MLDSHTPTVWTTGASAPCTGVAPDGSVAPGSAHRELVRTPSAFDLPDDDTEARVGGTLPVVGPQTWVGVAAQVPLLGQVPIDVRANGGGNGMRAGGRRFGGSQPGQSNGRPGGGRNRPGFGGANNRTDPDLAPDVTVGLTLTGALTPAGLGTSTIIPLAPLEFVEASGIMPGIPGGTVDRRDQVLMIFRSLF